MCGSGPGGLSGAHIVPDLDGGRFIVCPTFRGTAPGVALRATLSDGGGIYTLGLQAGTVLRNNVIHDSTGWEGAWWGNGIYHDNGSSEMLDENNFIEAAHYMRGWMLPMLVSGSTIVAMVLSLPTTGPLMLNALMEQDMYLTLPGGPLKRRTFYSARGARERALCYGLLALLASVPIIIVHSHFARARPRILLYVILLYHLPHFHEEPLSWR